MATPISLREFITIRAGTGKPRGRITTMFLRAFNAPTLASFWHYWNPVYGYLLARYVYRPARKFLPRSIAVIWTFSCSGLFLHDLPFIWLPRLLQGRGIPLPIFMVWFIYISLGLIMVESSGFGFRSWNKPTRILAHFLFLGATLLLASITLTHLAFLI